MIKIRRMTIDDLPLGLRLSRQAGWNQTESDWRRFMNMEPEGCFVGELDGSSAGTTTTCVFDQVAWIAMVLVDKNYRGRGLGTELLKHALNYLDVRKARTIRLDATAAGQPIYEKLGFVPEYELPRFEGTVRESGCGESVPACRCVEGVQPCRGHLGRVVPKASRLRIAGGTPATRSRDTATLDVFSDLIDFDRRMTGTDRAKMLNRLFEEFPEHIRIVRQGNQLEGFVTMRPGANAIQVGPCIGLASAGPSLLSYALNRCAGRPVFVDIPLDNVCAVKIAESSGLRVQRSFTRMSRGVRVKHDVQTLWASSGPEKG